MVLGDEATGASIEGRDGRGGPPVSVVAVLIVVAAGAVEGVGELVAGDGAEGAVAEVCRDVYVEDGELHNAGWEDDFVAGGVVVGVYGWGEEGLLV